MPALYMKTGFIRVNKRYVEQIDHDKELRPRCTVMHAANGPTLSLITPYNLNYKSGSLAGMMQVLRVPQNSQTIQVN